MKKKHVKRAALILFAAALTAAAGYTVFLKSEQEEEQYIYKEEKASFGTLFQGITENGSVEFLTTEQKYELELETDDEEDDNDEDDEDNERYLRIETVSVTPGQRIREGDPVFTLTERSVESVRRKLRAAQKEAETELAQLQSEYAMSGLEAKHTYQSSALNGKKAEAEYQISTEALQKEIEKTYGKISVLQQENEQIDRELADSWEDYDDLREACEEAETEFNRVDDSRLAKYIELRNAYLKCKEQYESEKQNRLDQRRKIDNNNEEILELSSELEKLQQKLPRQSLDAKQQYEDSAMEGALAGEIYSYSREALQDEIDTASANLKEAKEAMEAFEAFVGDGAIYAQGSGLVTEVGYKEGDYLVEAGTLIAYVDSDDYVITIDVSEEDIPSIQVQDAVSIVFTAYPDETFSGTVREITTSASQEHSTTVSYPVTVKIEGDTSKLYGGMTGDVTFVTDQKEETVYVSRKAVIEQDGKSYVYRKGSNGEMKLTPVETGFTDGVHIQIVSGLSEGDTVYIAGRAGTGQEGE